MRPTLKFVTDPMCSWCWAMTPHIESTLRSFDGRVAFDLAVGGINIHTRKPLGRHGLERLQALWHHVTAVTGQCYSHRLPEGTIYNSQLPCLALEAMRTLTRDPPFAYLHYLQRLLFVDGVNINNLDVLLEACEELGADPDLLVALLDREPVRARTRCQIVNSRRYGTNALPSVLASDDGAEFRLFAGGYMDADELEADIERWLSR